MRPSMPGSFKQQIGLLFAGLSAGLLASGILAQPAAVPDGGMCRSLCENEKQQCRTRGGAADAASTAGAVGLLGWIIGQPKAFAGTQDSDAKRDMREVLDAKQRAADDAKLARRETDDQCNSAYLQCRGACLQSPSPPTTP